MIADDLGLPFIFADSNSEYIIAEPWCRFTDDEAVGVPVQPVFVEFDPAVSDRFFRKLRVRLTDLKGYCRLDPEDELLLTVVAWSKQARKRYRAFGPTRLSSFGDEEVVVEIEASIDGGCIAGSVDLITDIVIDGPVKTTDIFAASTPGSVLWRHSQTVEVEGDSAQFPISSGAFSEMPWIRSQGAPWHLQFEPQAELDLPFTSIVRLYINSENPNMRNYQKRPEILQFIKYDIARSLLGAYLTREEMTQFEEGADPRSLGGVVAMMAKTLFHGFPFQELAEEIRNSPGHFDSSIRAAVGLFHV